ncbi:MAG: succinylglutamate desuccinylase [Candidatus Azotimanducaceae bacterium]|jgi:succinylglutamate desuccinylase
MHPSGLSGVVSLRQQATVDRRMTANKRSTVKRLLQTGDWLGAVLEDSKEQPDPGYLHEHAQGYLHEHAQGYSPDYVETAKLRFEQPATGVLMITPLSDDGLSGDKKSIVISAGIHGNETAPMEMLNDIVTAILSDQLEVRSRLLLVIGHPPAAVAARRFLNMNLNRLFSGAHKDHPSCYETHRAAALEGIMDRFFQDHGERFHYDLHTAIRSSAYEKFAISPFGQALNPAELGLLANCGIEAVLQNHQPATTFSSYSHLAFGTTAFTFELGKVAPFGQNQLDLSGIHQHLLHQIADLLEPPFAGEPTVFRVVHELIRTSEQYRLNIDSTTPNFAQFKPNTLIETDGLKEYRTAHSDETIVFPNPDVPIGQRTGLMIVKTYK